MKLYYIYDKEKSMNDRQEFSVELEHITANLTQRYASLSGYLRSIREAASAIIRFYEYGSAADAKHIVGELMKGFMKKRPLVQDTRATLITVNLLINQQLIENLQYPLPVLALIVQLLLRSDFGNDVDASLVLVQKAPVYGKRRDMLFGFSTLGNTADVISALIIAQALGLTTIGLTGATDRDMAAYCDIVINVPETSTQLVQEPYLLVYRALCRMVETHFLMD